MTVGLLRKEDDHIQEKYIALQKGELIVVHKKTCIMYLVWQYIVRHCCYLVFIVV